jgi:hypothetical protein
VEQNYIRVVRVFVIRLVSLRVYVDALYNIRGNFSLLGSEWCDDGWRVANVKFVRICINLSQTVRLQWHLRSSKSRLRTLHPLLCGPHALDTWWTPSRFCLQLSPSVQLRSSADALELSGVITGPSVALNGRWSSYLRIKTSFFSCYSIYFIPNIHFST